MMLDTSSLILYLSIPSFSAIVQENSNNYQTCKCQEQCPHIIDVPPFHCYLLHCISGTRSSIHSPAPLLVLCGVIPAPSHCFVLCIQWTSATAMPRFINPSIHAQVICLSDRGHSCRTTRETTGNNRG